MDINTIFNFISNIWGIGAQFIRENSFKIAPGFGDIILLILAAIFSWWIVSKSLIGQIGKWTTIVIVAFVVYFALKFASGGIL